MTDLVSVIIPTFGRPKYLQRAVESALQQTYPFVEIIVVDDNQPNSAGRRATETLMSELVKNDRVIYIRHPENRNGSAARNTGFSVSRGRYVSFLDDDDELLPNKLERQIHWLRSNPNFQAVYCLNNSFHSGNLIQTTTYCASGNCTFDILSLKSDIHTSSLLIDRNCVQAIGGFDESFHRHQEYEFMIRFFERYQMGCLQEVLLNVHIESSMNRPNVNRLIEAKKHYFMKMRNCIDQLSVEQQTEVYRAHDLHLFRTCLKNFDVRAFKYFSWPTVRELDLYFSPFVKKYIRLAIFRIKNHFTFF